MIDLDDVFETIVDPDPDVLNDHFRSLCHYLLQKIDLKRQNMAFTPYERDRVIIFVNEMYYTAFLNKGRKRLNGESVFEAHLVGTIENLLNDLNLTGLTSLMSGLKHDDIEDLGLTAERLFRSSTYRRHLTMVNENYLLKLQQNVYRIVTGITKVKKETRKKTKEETFRRLMEFIRDHGIRVGYVKIADRTHNMETLAGHGVHNLDKQIEIARETEELYIPLARLFRIEQSEARLIRACLRVVNPRFLSEFEEMHKLKMREYLQPFKDIIRDKLLQNWTLENEEFSVQFAERTLAHLLHSNTNRIPLAELRLSDLHIDDLDPNYEINILVKNPQIIINIIGRIIQLFAEQGEKLNLSAIEPDTKRGALVKIYNRIFRGRMYFRINDTISNERSKRGLLADIDDKPPRGLHEGINAILASGDDESGDIMTMARKELLQPHFTVYTPHNKPVDLPLGATPLDFAGKIHEDVLKGAQRAYIFDDIWGKNRREISLFDDLPDGVMVYVESCLSSHRGRSPNPDAINVDPGWTLFCQASSRNILYRFLRSNPQTSFLRGEAFLGRVSHLCSEIPSTILAELRRVFHQYESASDQAIITAIGRAELNSLRLIASLPLFQRLNSWTLRVFLPNKPLSFSQFTSELGGAINIEPGDMEKSARGVLGMVLFHVSIDLKRIEKTEFIRRMLKVSYKDYSISLSAPIPRECD